MVHHHPILLPTLAEPGRGYDAINGAQHLLTMLHRYGFHVLLHGHKHYPHTFHENVRNAFERTDEHTLVKTCGDLCSSQCQGTKWGQFRFLPKNLCLLRLDGGEGGIRTLGTGYPVRQISNLVPSTTRPPLRLMKSSTYAVFTLGATSEVSKKCPRFLDPTRPFASRSTESVSTFLNQCE